MSHIISSRNLFIDTSADLNGSQGDNITLQLGADSIHAASGQQLKLTLTYFSMYRNYRQKLLDFKSKKIGWISCRLSDIVELRSAMGERLITSSLPQNPSTSWISVPEITLAGFGKHSTRNQRKSSLKWLEYWTDSLVYTINRRNILLHTITPKNRILINQQDSIAVSNYLEFYKKKSPFYGVIVPAAMSQLSRKNQAFYNALFYNYTASND